MTLTVGSLFSGIGGLDLGLERAGMTVKWQSEIDPYASRVLAKHWPVVPNLGDITQIDWEDVERVDLICGGYPCQPFSLAGRRAGTDDDRHLWPHFAECLRVLRPRFALLENVPGHIGLGFDEVLGDLAALGFDAEWSTLSTCSLGAPHTRERLFVVAHAEGARLERFGMPAEGTRRGQQADREPQGPSETPHWMRVPLTRPIGVAAGVPRPMDDVDRLRCLGNAVVPQVAEWIGRRLLEQLEAVA